MNRRHLYPAAIGLTATGVLCAFHLAGAMRLTGSYSNRADVLAGVAVGLAASYAIVLVAGCLAGAAIAHIERSAFRVGLVLALALAVHFLLLFAPLGAFFSLAVTCKVQWLCPDYANPIGWALSGVVIPGRVELMSPWVAMGAVALSYFAAKRMRANEA